MKGRTPLSGADAFLRIIEWMMLDAGQGSHLGLTVVTLGTGFDAARFRAAVEKLAAATPLAAARVRHTFPGVPRWEWNSTARAAFPVEEHALDHDLATFCERRLNEPMREAVRFDILPADGAGTVLVMCWRHALLDGKGAELLLAEVDRLAADPAAAARAESWGPAQTRALGWREFLGDAERFKDHFYGSARWAISSLSGTHPGASAARFALVRFSAEETAQISRRAQEVTRGMFLLAWYLAVSTRVHRAVWLKRGAEPASYQAGCAVQERKKGARHPIWQNQVSQLFFRLLPEEAASLSTAARSLHEQFAALTRARMPQAFSSMAGLLRRLPLGWYLRFIRRHSGGHLTSFFYSHTGPFLPECRTFCSAPVLGGWHIPAVSAPPGTGIFFSEHGGCLTATISWREGVLAGDEIELMRATLRAELLG